MPNSPASDIGQYILDNTLATIDESNTSLPLLRIGFEPDLDTHTLLTLYDIGGPPSNPAYQRDEPRIQVRTKSKDERGYPQAYNLQQDIKDLILGMDRVVINGTLYVGVWQQVDISTLSPDYNSRIVLVSSYRMVREYSTPNRIPIE